MKTYKETIEICEQALDFLDIKRFLVLNKDVDAIIDNIEFYLYENQTVNCNKENLKKLNEFMSEYPEIFGDLGELFNSITDDEFIEYCQKRYPEIHWGHEVIERYWVSS